MQANLYGRRSPPHLPHDPEHWDLLTNHTNEEIFKSCLLIKWTSDGLSADRKLHFWLFYHPDFAALLSVAPAQPEGMHLTNEISLSICKEYIPHAILARLIFLTKG